MRGVESPSNPVVQRMRGLHTAAGRREQGEFLIEGTRLVGEAVAASWPIGVALYDAERARSDERLASLVGQIPNALPASPRAIKHASDTVTPQGIVATARMPARLDAIDPTEPIVLILDGLADPGNAGTLLRSALAAGVRTVLALKETVELFSPKVVRAGMGAHFHLSLRGEVTWGEVEALLGNSRVLAVAEAFGATPYYRFDWHRSTGLIVGGEAHGPSAEALRRASTRLSIPLTGGVESLNAAIAGSVILFEAKRQRDTEGGRSAGPSTTA